jgi:SAM-dependent methyltransferase
MDSTQRFSDRVEDYVKYRPGYPNQIIELLARRCGLQPSSVVADIGSGTGILAKLFCDYGNQVFGLEPNQAMREAGESYLAEYRNFVSVNATAEATTLESGSIDLLVAGQSFHWFRIDETRQEFLRILKPAGWAVLIWNERNTKGRFGSAYEALMSEFGDDYDQVRRRGQAVDSSLDGFFGLGGFKRETLQHVHYLDRQGLVGLAASASYMPRPGHARYAEMLSAMNSLFHQHQQHGKIGMEYDTNVYYGRME